MNGEHKISSSHRDRAALVYLRQSSMAHVREHTESTRSQYALADKAAALGWPRTSIDVIDTDLGIAGKWGVARTNADLDPEFSSTITVTDPAAKKSPPTVQRRKNWPD